MKLMIFGHARHGKDTVAEILQEEAGFLFESSSHCVAELLRSDLEQHIGRQYSSLEACYEDRVNHRQFWHEWIIEYNKPLHRLSEHILTTYDMYVGIRNPKEYNAAREMGLFDLGIWVDRSLHQPPESIKSNRMTISDADIIIDNNGTLEQLKPKVQRLAKALLQ